MPAAFEEIQSNNLGAVTTISVTITLASGAAVHIVLNLDNGLASLAPIAQTVGPTLTLVATNDNSGACGQHYVATGVAGGATTFTFTWAIPTGATIYAVEVSSERASLSADVSAGSTFTTATTHATGTTATLSQADEIAIASWHGNASGSTGNLSLANGFTIPTGGNLMGAGIVGVRSLLAYKILASAAAVSETLTSDSVAAHGMVSTYKAAAAVAAAVVVSRTLHRPFASKPGAARR